MKYLNNINGRLYFIALTNFQYHPYN